MVLGIIIVIISILKSTNDSQLANTVLQELIALRAIRDVNVPKFLMDDLKLFNGIVSDLFPNIQYVETLLQTRFETCRDSMLWS